MPAVPAAIRAALLTGSPCQFYGTPYERFCMTKIAHAALASAAALLLTACGSSDKASEGATPENVEMPAEEAMTGVEEGAAPASDAAAAPGAEASAGASAAATAPAAGASTAAEKATAEAEKKM
jgi:hypothetical protein